MLLLYFLALASTGAIIVMNTQRLRHVVARGWPYWGVAFISPFRATMFWGWIFWVVCAPGIRGHLRFTLPQWAALVLILLLSRFLKRLDKNLLARLAQPYFVGSSRIL